MPVSILLVEHNWHCLFKKQKDALVFRLNWIISFNWINSTVFTWMPKPEVLTVSMTSPFTTYSLHSIATCNSFHIHANLLWPVHTYWKCFRLFWAQVSTVLPPLTATQWNTVFRHVIWQFNWLRSVRMTRLRWHQLFAFSGVAIGLNVR